MRKRFLVKVGIKRFNTLYGTFLVLACIAGVEWGRGLGGREKGRGIGGEGIKGTFLSFPFRAFLLLQLPLPLPLPLPIPLPLPLPLPPSFLRLPRRLSSANTRHRFLHRSSPGKPQIAHVSLIFILSKVYELANLLYQ